MMAPTMGGSSESEPEMHVSMPKGMDMTGITMGKKCRLMLEGEVSGVSMGEYGGSVTLKGAKAEVQPMGEMAGEMAKHRASGMKSGGKKVPLSGGE